MAYLSGIGQVLQAAGHRVRILLPEVILHETRDLLQSMDLHDVACVDPSGMTMGEMLSRLDTLKIRQLA